MLLDTARRLLNRFLRRSGLGVPSNYDRILADADRIEADVRYAIQVARAYGEWLPGGFAELRGRSILEIGPGNNFGAALILKCAGAGRVAVTDRFLSRYQETYHARLYCSLRQAVAAEFPALDLMPMDTWIAAASHASGTVETLEMPLERVAQSEAGQFDLVFSNAVLEHVYSPEEAARSLFAVLAESGRGFHQVDFRDHRDFSRPLEYLLLDERSFRALLEETHCECGNRIRPHEMDMLMRRAGFRDPKFLPNMSAEPAYLNSFIPRLRSARDSPYRDMAREKLEVIAGRLELARP